MPQTAAPTIVLSDVSKAYAGPGGTAPALSAIDLQVQPGEAVAIVGRSGSGKSTLINLITGIDRATRGEVHVAGAAVHSLNESAMALWRGRSLGLVFQFFQLLPTLTVLENVLLPMDFARRVPAADRVKRAEELLGTLGIAGHSHKFPQQLSGGEQQRAAVARALANDPPVVVADEPTGNLDSSTGAAVMKLLTGLASTGRTVIVATHDQELLPLFTRVITLRDGRIVGDQPTAANG
jgi:putative ABC transport system ATP-binding protein